MVYAYTATLQVLPDGWAARGSAIAPQSGAVLFSVGWSTSRGLGWNSATTNEHSRQQVAVGLGVTLAGTA